MATFENFLPEIKMRAYGVSDPVVEMYTRFAIIDFLERTRLWTRNVQEWAFANDGRIVIGALDEDNEMLEAVVPGFHGGTIIGTLAPSAVGANMNAFAGLNFDGEQRGRPSYVFQLPDEPNTVGLWPIPDRQYADIVFTIVLKPTPTATVFPDFLLNHHREAIVEGALARIKEIPGQSFTDAGGAEVSRNRFNRLRLDGEVDARRGRTVSGDLMVQMRPFASGRR